MTSRATFLPVILIVIIAALTLIAVLSGRSNLPEVVVDKAYPHFACELSSYVVGDNRTDDAGLGLVLYLSHEDGRPRVEFPGMSPRAQLEDRGSEKQFLSEGGAVSGTFTVFNDRVVDFVGFSQNGGAVVEHYASGSCERLHQP